MASKTMPVSRLNRARDPAFPDRGGARADNSNYNYESNPDAARVARVE